jgi:hypothetical protein
MRDRVRDSEGCFALRGLRREAIDPPPSSMFLLPRHFHPRQSHRIA